MNSNERRPSPDCHGFRHRNYFSGPKSARVMVAKPTINWMRNLQFVLVAIVAHIDSTWHRRHHRDDQRCALIHGSRNRDAQVVLGVDCCRPPEGGNIHFRVVKLCIEPNAGSMRSYYTPTSIDDAVRRLWAIKARFQVFSFIKGLDLGLDHRCTHESTKLFAGGS